MSKYVRFAVMIATSTLVMFGLMYLHTYQASHVLFSETRAYMALIMGAGMAIVMLLFMLHMYEDRRKNVTIVIAAAVVFVGALWLVRSQRTVDDVSYMRARIRDPRVRELADEIIEAQRREIAEMKRLIAELEAAPPQR